MSDEISYTRPRTMNLLIRPIILVLGDTPACLELRRIAWVRVFYQRRLTPSIKDGDEPNAFEE